MAPFWLPKSIKISSWRSFGASWECPGCVLGRVGVVLGPLGVVLGASWDDLGRLGRIFGFWDVICFVFLIVAGVTGLSLGLAFALPGHIELIAVIFVTNLPLLFASTALAPLSFMAGWLQVVASLNPLTYAIEPIRYIYLNGQWSLGSIVLETPWLDINFLGVLLLLVGFDALILLTIQPLLRRRFA